MKRFHVIFETRNRGAIGVFSQSGEIVEMHQSSFSETEIAREAMHQLHARGLETRFPVRIEELPTTDKTQTEKAAA